MEVLDYLASILGFAAALIGIVGDTWNPSASGRRKLTSTGWAAVTIALTAFAVSICTSVAQHRIANAQERKQVLLAHHALARLEEATRLSLTPFAELYAAWNTAEGQASRTGVETLKGSALLKPKFVNYLYHLDLRTTGSPDYLLPGQSWGELIVSDLSRARDTFSATLAIAAPYLDTEVLTRVDAVYRSGILSDFPEKFAQIAAVEQRPSEQTGGAIVDYITLDTAEYVRFVEGAVQLQEVLEQQLRREQG